MGSITKYGRRWSGDGPTIVYDPTRTFISGDRNSRYSSSQALMAWWSLSSGVATGDGGDGTVKDKSGKSRQFSQTVSANQPALDTSDTPSTEISENSLLFDNSNDVLQETNSTSQFNFSNDDRSDIPFTISAWVKTSSENANDTIFSASQEEQVRGVIFAAHLDGAVYLRLCDNQTSINMITATTTGDKLYPGIWHHVAVTYDASYSVNGIKIYIDGVLQTTSASTTGTYLGMKAYAPEGARIGGAKGGYNFAGNIADVAVWKKVLTTEEIKALYHAEDGVYWQIRNYQNKGSSTKKVGNSGGVEPEDFIQGINHRTMKTLHKSILPKIKANSDPILVRNGRPIDTIAFDDVRAPMNYGWMKHKLRRPDGGELSIDWDYSKEYFTSKDSRTPHHTDAFGKTTAPIYMPWNIRSIGHAFTEPVYAADGDDVIPAGGESVKVAITSLTGTNDWPGGVGSQTLGGVGSDDDERMWEETPFKVSSFDPGTDDEIVEHIAYGGRLPWENVRHRVQSHALLRSRVSIDTGHGSTLDLAPNHYMEQRNLGQPNLQNNNEPYTDMSTFSPIRVILEDGPEFDIPNELLGMAFVVLGLSGSTHHQARAHQLKWNEPDRRWEMQQSLKKTDAKGKTSGFLTKKKIKPLFGSAAGLENSLDIKLNLPSAKMKKLAGPFGPSALGAPSGTPNVLESIGGFENFRGTFPGIDLVNQPPTRPGDSYTGIGLMDGVIEPFPIRSIADRSDMDIPFQVRGARGQVGDGEDAFRSEYFIEDQYALPGHYNPMAPFLDDSGDIFGVDVMVPSGSSHYWGAGGSSNVNVNADITMKSSKFLGAFATEGFLNPNITYAKPFNDSSDLFERTKNISDNEIASALLMRTFLSSSAATNHATGSVAKNMNHSYNTRLSLYGGGSREAAMAGEHFDGSTEHALNLKLNHVFPSRGGFSELNRRHHPIGTDSIVYTGLKR